MQIYDILFQKISWEAFLFKDDIHKTVDKFSA